jgi:hypothetical protein
MAADGHRRAGIRRTTVAVRSRRRRPDPWSTDARAALAGRVMTVWAHGPPVA